MVGIQVNPYKKKPKNMINMGKTISTGLCFNPQTSLFTFF